MKASDTVMSQIQKEAHWNGYLIGKEDGIRLGKQAGIEEVVEWLGEHSQLEKCDPDVMAYFNEYRWIEESEWQSKLRELRLEKKEE